MPSFEDPFKEDFEDLFQNAPCGYVSLSPDGRIIKVNGTLATWLGWTPDDLFGTPIIEHLTFGGRIAYETHLAPRLRLQERMDEIAFDLLHSDGSKIPVIANASEKRDVAGRHILTRMTLFRAVERRNYERALLGARERAEATAIQGLEAAALREQFIAVLGHDLRNPLAALLAGVRLLEKREALSDRGQTVLREMNASLARANALVANLLDFARGRLGGGLSLSRNADEPLKPVLEQVVAEIRAVAPTREIRSAYSIKEPVSCDRVRIAQLASNLLSNAISHGSAHLPIKLRATTADGHFILSVSNGGEPIPAKARAHLFQPFFRGSVRRNQQGLGLGLFIVSEIAKAHDGTMAVASDADLTTFTFQMPATKLEHER